MSRPAGSLLLGGALIAVLSAPAHAQLANPGFTGLISTPTPEPLAEGKLALGFSWLDGPNTYLYAPKTNRLLAVAVGLLPGFEASFRLTQIVGMIDPEAPGVAYNTDRMASFKYCLPLPRQWPKVAVGMQDIASANELSGHPMTHGTSQYGQSTLFSVIGDSGDRWSWHVGWGLSQAFINGGFGGAAFRPLDRTWLLVEHDSRHFNYGLRVSPVDSLWLQIARIGGSTWAIGTSLVFDL